MIIVDGTGQIRKIPNEVPLNLTPETVLSAAQVNLGLFGVMVEITIAVKPMVNADVYNNFTYDLSVSQILHC